MNVIQGGKRWKGLVASIILSGAGQFFSGARRRGLMWCAFLLVGSLTSLILLTLSWMPARAWPFVVGFWGMVWLAMLYDSYRPIARLRWWAWTALIIVSLALSEVSSKIAHRLLHAFRDPTQAMTPTFFAGDNVLVSRFAYWFQEPKRGDLIVFKTADLLQIPQDPAEADVRFLKRLVGLPGDRIVIGEGTLLINDAKVEFGDPAHPIEYRCRDLRTAIMNGGKESYVVPDHQYFVLGDNSANSFDSRYFGTIPREAIYGKVTRSMAVESSIDPQIADKEVHPDLTAA